MVKRTSITGQGDVSNIRISPGTGAITIKPSATGDITIPNNQAVQSSSYPTIPVAEVSSDYLDLIRFSNLTSGVNDKGVYAALDRTQGFYDFKLKSISVGDGLVIEETPTSIRLSTAPVDDTIVLVQGGQNESNSGGLVFKGIDSDSIMRFRNIVSGQGLTLTQTPSTITIGLTVPPSIGDITNAANVGNLGVGIFQSKDTNTLNFRNIVSGNAILTTTISSNGNQVVLTVNENAMSLSNLAGTLSAGRVTGLAAVATTGSYTSLSNQPTIPTTLESLTNVNGVATNGQVLTFNGSNWAPVNPPDPASFIQNTFTGIKIGNDTITANTPTTIVNMTGSNGVTLSSNLTTKTITASLEDSGVNAGTYTLSSVTVDRFGRITNITNGSASSYIDPMTTAGDIVFRNSNNNTARLPVGQTNAVLTVFNGVPTWRVPTEVQAVTSIGILAGNGMQVAGSPITSSGNITVGLRPTGVPVGTFRAATITVDAYGRITGVSENQVITQSRMVATGVGLTGGGDLSSDRTLTLAPSGVTSGSYSNPTITVDQYGRITNASTGLPGLVDPTTNIGDMIYRSVSGLSRIAQGTEGQVLSIVGGTPAWATPAAGSGGGTPGTGTVTYVGAIGENGVTVTGGPVTDIGSFTVGLTPTGVVPATYTNPELTVDTYGRVVDIQPATELSVAGKKIADATGCVYTAAFELDEIEDITSELNTIDKDAGKIIIDFTTPRMLIASGPLPDDFWFTVDGATQITPS